RRPFRAVATPGGAGPGLLSVPRGLHARVGGEAARLAWAGLPAQRAHLGRVEPDELRTERVRPVVHHGRQVEYDDASAFITGHSGSAGAHGSRGRRVPRVPPLTEQTAVERRSEEH